MRCRGVDETNCITRGSSQPSDRAPIERVFAEHLAQALDTGDPAMRTADKRPALPVRIFWMFCRGKPSPSDIRVLWPWPGAAEQTERGQAWGVLGGALGL